MKMKFIIFAFFSVLMLQNNSSAAGEAAKAVTKESVMKAIEEAKHCNTADDCTTAFFGCPFGCGTPVNENETSNIKDLIEIYHESNPQCKYKCAHPAMSLHCTNNICELKN